MLAEVGKVTESLKYCQAPEVDTWRQLVSSLEERIRTHQQDQVDPLKEATSSSDKAASTSSGVSALVIRFWFTALAKDCGVSLKAPLGQTGDRLPLGPPSLMMSPQPMKLGKVRPHLVEKRDCKYKISVDDLKMSRVEIEEPEWINPQADYWKQHGKGFVVLIEPIEMKKMAPFP
ncbi:Oil body-associated protein 2C [Camellia lanceoleosa]|uniref:Oil body-associated protein 2C n=1 Tax=Camellia lanceoleosa TaxID=1840588 RepID=A0ACC0GFC3_9ERIC|nr:Oil body-associated protein 2C [Camellia lanceoleosa]